MPDIGDMERAIRRGRNSQLLRLSREYRPVAERLARAYGNILPGINAALNGMTDALGPTYPAGASEAGQRAIQSFLQTVRDDLDQLRVVLADELAGLEAGAVQQGVRGGVANLNAGGMSVQFNQPLLEAVAAGVDYVDSPAFKSRLLDLAGHHAGAVQDEILAGIAAGENPRATARRIRDYFNLSARPLIDAENWARTTQNYAYRQGTRGVYEKSGVEKWIWSSALDDRTCVACIAMHGSVHPVSEVLNDHHRGRCAMIPVTPTWAELGFDDGQDMLYETGPEWLARQDRDTQLRMLGPELFGAYDRGIIAFNEQTIVTTYQNDIFGPMRRRRANYEIIGGSTTGQPRLPLGGPSAPDVIGRDAIREFRSP